ncbi:MAG: hypothetical protein HQL37_12475 [Alphaproteobacteria bacterium]|nr:hypothetical protein [Alphaproteobacteria bacterium]
MAGIHKFMFDECFDDPNDRQQKPRKEVLVLEPVEEAPPPPPTFSGAELEQARKEGYAAGHGAGLKDATASIGQMTANALKAIATQMAGISAVVAKANDDAANNAVALAIAVAAKLMPSLASRYGMDEIAELVEKCLPEILEQPRLIIRVNPELVESVLEQVSAIADNHGFAGRLLIHPNEALPPGDCRIEWGEGGIDRDSATLWREIETIVTRNTNLSFPDTQEEPNPGAAPVRRPVTP